MKHCLICINCKKKYKPSIFLLRCDDCNSVVKVEYDHPPKDKNSMMNSLMKSSFFSLGDGDTPIIHLRNLGKKIEHNFLYAKLEFLSPTGSFKDRGSNILMNIAKNFGVNEFIEDSSGNAGASLAAYASFMNINANIFIPHKTPDAKKEQIRVYGAKLFQIEGSRNDTTISAINYSEDNDILYLSHNLSPYFSEGMKNVTYEIIKEGFLFDHVILPVGNGSLLLGMYSAYEALYKQEKITNIPKFHAIQASSVSPIYNYFHGIDWDISQALPTLAGGIAVSNPPRIFEISESIRKSKGTVMTVEEKDMIYWKKYMSENEGLFIEVTCSAALAGLNKLLEEKKIGPNEKVLIPLTGTGLKELK